MILENKNFHKSIALLSFILAFIFLILFISQIYTFTVSQPQGPQEVNRPPPPKNDFFRGMPKESPFMSVIFFLGFIVNLSSGILVYIRSDKTEKKNLKSKIIEKVLLPEEKMIISLFEENNGEMTQSDLVKKSSLSKLKVSRILKKLESSNIVKKYPYGLTNKIKIISD